MKNETNEYAAVVTVHGVTVLDGRGRLAAGNRHLTWSEDFSDCVPYVRLPETPTGNEPYASAELYSADCVPAESLGEIPGTSTYWPTLEDYENGVNGIAGHVQIWDFDKTVRFVYG